MMSTLIGPDTKPEPEPIPEGPTLLPKRLAFAVTAVTQTTGTLIRASTKITTWSMDVARTTTVSGLGVGMSFLETAMCYAGRDVQQLAGYPLAMGHVEPVVEGSLDALYRGMTCLVFVIAATFRLSSSMVETTSHSTLVFLTVLNQFFGSTDSSRAMASIIDLIRREFRNPATGIQGETVGVKDLLISMAAFAYLQNACVRITEEEDHKNGVDEIVWDVVVLDDGARIDVHDVHDISLYGSHKGKYNNRRRADAGPETASLVGVDPPMPTRSRVEDAEATLHEQIASQLPANAKVVVSTNTVTTKTITVDVPTNASHNLQLAPPPGAVIVQQESMSGPGSQTRRIVYRIQRSESSSATAQRLEDNGMIPGTSNVGSMECDLEPSLVSHAMPQLPPPLVRPITEILSRPCTAVDGASTLGPSTLGPSTLGPLTLGPLTPATANGPLTAPPTMGFPDSPLKSPTTSPETLPGTASAGTEAKTSHRTSFLRSRQPEDVTTKDRRKTKDSKDKETFSKQRPQLSTKLPEKRKSIRNAFKIGSGSGSGIGSGISALWNRDLDIQHAKLVRKRGPPMGYRSNQRPVPSRRPISPTVTTTSVMATTNAAAATAAVSSPLKTEVKPPKTPTQERKAPVLAVTPEEETEMPTRKIASKSQHSHERDDDENVMSPAPAPAPAPPMPRNPNAVVAVRSRQDLLESPIQNSDTLHPLPPSPIIPFGSHRRNRSLGSRHSLGLPCNNNNPSRRKSQLLNFNPSLYSLGTANESQSSLVYSHAYYQRSAYNTEALNALRQTGMIDTTFPRFHILRNVTRYILFSSASYGSHFLRYLGLSSDEKPRFEPAAHKTHRDIRAFAQHTNIPPESVILASFVDNEGGSNSQGSTGSGVPLVHYIALDHESKAVVLACRGTLGFEDVLADLTCEYDEMEWRGQQFQVHKGVHASARRILYGEDGKVLATLKATLDEFPDYGLVLTGHSLGGAVTALLGVMLADPNPNALGFVTAFTGNSPDSHAHLRPPAGRPIHVYAYGAPSTMCRRLQKATRGLITSVVQGNDLVPYLSLGVLHDFQALSAAFKSEGGSARSSLSQYITNQLQNEFLERWYGSSAASLSDDQGALVTSGDRSEWAVSLLQSLRASMNNEKLLPPGEVFLVECTNVLRRDLDTGPMVQGFLGSPAKRIVLRYVRDVPARFKEMRFRPSMLMDHSPSRYEETLNRLRIGVEQVWM